MGSAKATEGIHLSSSGIYTLSHHDMIAKEICPDRSLPVLKQAACPEHKALAALFAAGITPHIHAAQQVLHHRCQLPVQSMASIKEACPDTYLLIDD